MNKKGNNRNAIILCSGGLDSVVTTFYAKKTLKYDNIKILFFNYGQKSLKEERKSSMLCSNINKAEFIEINLGWLGSISESLINKSGKISKLDRKDLKDTKEESKKFYVPCRNTMFLVYALSLAESLWIRDNAVYDILVGFKCEGKESYPDTTKSFVKEMNNLSKIGCSRKFKIIAPLIEKDKEDIILLGIKLGINLEETFSCYSPLNGKQCGFCLSCRLRQEGFYWTNQEDKTVYDKK